MSRTIERQTVPAQPAREVDVVADIVCDLCGAKGGREAITDGEINWSKEPGGYSLDTVAVSNKVGYCYPEGADWRVTSFDICAQCFREKLTPWMRTQGADPHAEQGGF